jgi:hypothetical protein
MGSLIQIDNDIRQLMLEIVENEGELDQALEERLENLMVSEKAKVTSFCNFLDALESESKFVDEKIKEAKAYKERIDNKIERILGYAKYILEKRGEKSIEGVLGKKLTMREYESVQIDCPAEDLPFDYVTEDTKYTPNKQLIKAAIKLGEEIPGCRIVKTNKVSWK